MNFQQLYDKLDFEVREEELFVSGRKSTGHKALINDNNGGVMSVVTLEYKTIQNRDGFIPMLSRMEQTGWELMPAEDRQGRMRRAPVRMERNGARIFVDLTNPMVSFDMPSRVATPGLNKLQLAAKAIGSFDRSHTHDLKAMMLELWCTNGAMRPIQGMGMSGRIKHIGSNVDARLSELNELGQQMIERYDDIRREWESLARTVPTGPAIASALALTSAERGEEKERIVCRDARQFARESYTAWEIYQLATRRLTIGEKFRKMAEASHDKKHADTLAYLTGAKVPESWAVEQA